MIKSTIKWMGLVAIATTAWSSPNHASTVIPGDTITGVFSNVQTSGYDLNNPTVGHRAFVDNAATAIYSGVGTNTLTWGANTETFTLGTPYSTIQFLGNIIPEDYTSPFTVGTITFTNGTSSTSSIIFGATLNFYDGSNLIGQNTVIINTTHDQYSGTDLTPAELATDADYVNICGPGSNICLDSIEAYENTETTSGSSFEVGLTGYIDQLVLTGVTVITPDTGTIGSELPLASVPEPSSFVLVGGAGLIGLAGVLRRRG